MSDELSLSISLQQPYDLVATLATLSLGAGDPCLRIKQPNQVQLALDGPEGPLTVMLCQQHDAIDATLKGKGSDWLAPLIAKLLGLHFQPPTFSESERLKRLARNHPGLRLPQLPVLFPRLVQICLQQLVSFHDASHGWRMLVRRYGRTISSSEDLLAPPTSQVLARMAPYQFVECGILPEHGRRIARLARIAGKIERAWNVGSHLDAVEATSRLISSQHGVGPWTIGYLRGSAMGDSDAVLPGDYSLPSLVALFFTGRERGTDEEMLEMLAPFRPYRFYVTTLLQKSIRSRPRRGPRRRRLRDRL